MRSEVRLGGIGDVGRGAAHLELAGTGTDWHADIDHGRRKNVTARSAEAECASVLSRFFQNLDLGRYDAAAVLFWENGTYTTPNASISGRENLCAAFAARPATHTTRHVISTFGTEPAEGDLVRGMAYLQMYRSTSASESGPVSLPPLEAIADILCQFRRVADRWQIGEIVVRPALASVAT